MVLFEMALSNGVIRRDSTYWLLIASTLRPLPVSSESDWMVACMLCAALAMLFSTPLYPGSANFCDWSRLLIVPLMLECAAYSAERAAKLACVMSMESAPALLMLLSVFFFWGFWFLVWFSFVLVLLSF